jgi:hypothetical protein
MYDAAAGWGDAINTVHRQPVVLPATDNQIPDSTPKLLSLAVFALC